MIYLLKKMRKSQSAVSAARLCSLVLKTFSSSWSEVKVDDWTVVLHAPSMRVSSCLKCRLTMQSTTSSDSLSACSLNKSKYKRLVITAHERYSSPNFEKYN